VYFFVLEYVQQRQTDDGGIVALSLRCLVESMLKVTRPTSLEFRPYESVIRDR